MRAVAELESKGRTVVSMADRYYRADWCPVWIHVWLRNWSNDQPSDFRAYHRLEDRQLEIRFASEDSDDLLHEGFTEVPPLQHSRAQVQAADIDRTTYDERS